MAPRVRLPDERERASGSWWRRGSRTQSRVRLRPLASRRRPRRVRGHRSAKRPRDRRRGHGGSGPSLSFRRNRKRPPRHGAAVGDPDMPDRRRVGYATLEWSARYGRDVSARRRLDGRSPARDARRERGLYCRADEFLFGSPRRGRSARFGGRRDPCPGDRFGSGAGPRRPGRAIALDTFEDAQ